MRKTTLGRGGPVVSRVGLGLMGMSGIYGQADDQPVRQPGRDLGRLGLGKEPGQLGGCAGREYGLVHAADHDLGLEPGRAQHREPGRRSRREHDLRHAPDPTGRRVLATGPGRVQA